MTAKSARIVLCAATFVLLFVRPAPAQPRSMVVVPAGSYPMGNAWSEGYSNERPAHVDAVHGLQRIKAIRIANAHDVALCRRYHVEAFLLDAYVAGRRGGTGVTFDWRLAREARQFGPIMLAGGLTPENVEEAIQAAAPYAVDVASGVESEPGKKDKGLVVEFIRRAKATNV